MLQTLGSPRDPDSTGSSAGSKSVERCEGMVAEDVEAVSVVSVAEIAVAEADFKKYIERLGWLLHHLNVQAHRIYTLFYTKYLKKKENDYIIT